MNFTHGFTNKNGPTSNHTILSMSFEPEVNKSFPFHNFYGSIAENLMLRNLIFRVKKFLFQGVVLVAYAVRHILNFALNEEATSIPLGRQRRALATTVEYVERHMRHIDSVASKKELLMKAFKSADISGDRLICEFGVFMGSSINFIAKATTKPVFGFDSFEGLPERWRDGCDKGFFAVPRIPKVRENVTLIKGLFHETIPVFLNQNAGTMGFLHIDSDLYSSAKTVFDFLGARLRPGTVIVFDDYFNYPGWEEGESKAFMEFLDKNNLSFEFISYHRNAQQVAVILKDRGH
jgi:predicted O-methyltransferase YrrM